jgi:hypothetical protein
MPTVRHNVPEEPVTPFRKGLVSWRRLTPWLEKIWRNTGIIVSVDDNLDLVQIPGGLHISAARLAAAAAAAPPHPWQGTMSGENIIVNSGALNGDTVAGGTFATPSSGTRYVYLHIDCSLTVAYSYVNAFSITSAALAIASSVPADNTTSGDYYIPLIEITDRVITNQMMSSNIGFRARGDNTQTSAAIGEYWT